MRPHRAWSARELAPLLLASLAVLGPAAVAWHGVRGTQGGSVLLAGRQELFNWKQFSTQQGKLVRQADGLTAELGGIGAGQHSMSSSVQEKGAAIKQVLANLMEGLREKRRRAEPAHKYIPMDQELAILKVQKQMRSEHKFASDRIEGGGDVAAVVNEQEQADERSALMEGRDMGPDTKTKHLFENCEDGSLTAEDAELCGRRASAIKLITRRAIRKQLAKNPPKGPEDARGLIDAERENTARKDLIAYALIGKQYVALMNAEKKADAETEAQRKALLAQGRRRTGPKRQDLASETLSPRAPRVRPGKMNARVDRGFPRGGMTLAQRTHERSNVAHAQSHLHDAAASARSPTGSKPVWAPSPPTGGKRAKKVASGDLGPLQDLANSMPKHLPSPMADSKTRLEDLESAISSTQERLAKEKMRFTKEMLRRQKELQTEFVDSMNQIHTGLSVVDDVGESGASSAPTSQSMLAAEQKEFMQRQRDGVIAAAAAAAAPATPTTAATQQLNPVVAEVQREIAASGLFRHPPKPLVSAHTSVEDAEKDTVRAALDQQFAQVASDGRVAPKVRHDKWSDLMTKMSQVLSLQTPTASVPADTSDGKGTKGARSLELKLGTGDGAVGTVAGPGGVKNTMNRQRLRLLSSYGYKQRLHRSHVGPASYDALAAAATADLKAAVRNGAPTLQAATRDAFKADQVANSPQVFFERSARRCNYLLGIL